MSSFTTPALRWLSLILEERFGHAFLLEQKGSSLMLSLASMNEGKIIFTGLQPSFHQPDATLSCAVWDVTTAGWESALEKSIIAPGVSELPDTLIEKAQENYIIHYDILGLTYWMLNRIEEIGHTVLDNHGRFPAIESHAFKHGYLERPIVDEWLHILGQVIQKTWPNIKLKTLNFSMKVSHDVDSPCLYQFKPWKTILRMMAGHLLKRHDLKAFLIAPYLKLTAKGVLQKRDPFNTFDWLMDISEANNIKSAFYFICGRTSNMDADYEPENKAIRELMQRIHNRGHEIGLHPSYGTYQKPELIKKEADRLKRIIAEEGIPQTKFGGRMHYLRWEHPTTLQAWNDAGMSYDTTLSYADRPGFRCGTCHEYPAFNPATQEILQIRIRPLIVMECTVIDSAYLGLPIKEALNKMVELKNICKQVDGCFTLLWHNSYFEEFELKRIYQYIIEN